MRLIYQRVTVPITCPPALRGEGGGELRSLAGPQSEASRLSAHLVPSRPRGTGSGKRHHVLTSSDATIHAEVLVQKLLHPQPSARLLSLLPSTQDGFTLSPVTVRWCGRGTMSPRSRLTDHPPYLMPCFLPSAPPRDLFAPCSFCLFPRQPAPISVPHSALSTKFS